MRELSASWRDIQRMQVNLAMLRYVLDLLLVAAPGFRQLARMQGMKAYGVQVDPTQPIPLRENRPRHPHDNFYSLQEDHVRAAQSGVG